MQAIALCQFLENNRQQVNLLDKAVLEIGAGTGLLSIVACLLGESISGVSNLSDVDHMLTTNACRHSVILVFVFARLRDL